MSEKVALVLKINRIRQTDEQKVNRKTCRENRMSCNPKIKAFVSMRNKVYFKALFSNNINLQTANFPCFKSPSSSWCFWVWISNGSLFFRSRSMFTSVTDCRGSHRTSHVVWVSSLSLFFTRHFVPLSENRRPLGEDYFAPGALCQNVMLPDHS